MGRLSFVSLGFLILPIAVTVGVLLGMQSYRTSRGQTPLFVSNAVHTATYCQLAFGITPDTDGQQYTRKCLSFSPARAICFPLDPSVGLFGVVPPSVRSWRGAWTSTRSWFQWAARMFYVTAPRPVPALAWRRSCRMLMSWMVLFVIVVVGGGGVEGG